MGADAIEDGKYRCTDQYHAILPAKLEGGFFFGLQRPAESILNEDVQFFWELRTNLKSKAVLGE